MTEPVTNPTFWSDYQWGREFSNAIKDIVNQLLANGVVTTGVVVSSVLLARNHLFGMKEVLVAAVANLVNNTEIF